MRWNGLKTATATLRDKHATKGYKHDKITHGQHDALNS